jgi:hypothetical protein
LALFGRFAVGLLSALSWNTSALFISHITIYDLSAYYHHPSLEFLHLRDILLGVVSGPLRNDASPDTSLSTWWPVACPAKLQEPPDKHAPNFDPACAEVVQLVLSTTTGLRPISVAAKNMTSEPVFARDRPSPDSNSINKQFHCSPLPLYNACLRLLPKLSQSSISYCYCR